MAKERLVGSDGKLVTVKLGASGDWTVAGWYVISEIADTGSAFAAGFEVGDPIYLATDPELAATDEVQLMTENEQADITAFSLEISKAEIDVTTLSDEVRRYRTGKVDMTGSLEGIITLDETDAAGWVINNFMKTIKQTAAATWTIAEADDSPIYIKGVLQKDTSAGEKESFFWAKVNLLGANLGASGEDAQSFSSNFRIAPGDPDPVFYVRTIPAA